MTISVRASRCRAVDVRGFVVCPRTEADRLAWLSSARDVIARCEMPSTAPLVDVLCYRELCDGRRGEGRSRRRSGA
jgi:hypothetical protein